VYTQTNVFYESKILNQRLVAFLLILVDMI